MSEPGSPLDRLFRQPYAFSFFEAVWLLERASRAEAAADGRFEKRDAIGEDGDPRKEAVRLRALPALTFPAAEIQKIVEPKAADQTEDESALRRPPGPPEMTVAFLGLTGPSGALPQHYSETLLRDLRGRSTALRDFFDIFNHRSLSLFFRAWEKYRLPAFYDRFGAGGDDPISRLLYAFCGFGTRYLRNGDFAEAQKGPLEIDDESVLHYSGHLAHWPRSALGLESLLSDYFERTVKVEQFQGRWIRLREDETSLLPTRARPKGRFCALGVDAICGDRVWDVQSNFRLRLGPLTYKQFVAFMPDGRELKKLAHLGRLYVGPGMSFDAQLTLKKEEVPRTRLGAEGELAPRLGWNTWVKSTPFEQDVDDSVFILDNL
ncbi:MAG: type VI secretion system baseplate subunit TssG [Alphaproteobacteria bacterium]|jgi:type VI secretion system protein ImpH|nr:type VI secretion system baseplate subunit TssG [Alphaproteobacteria bacterium]